MRVFVLAAIATVTLSTIAFGASVRLSEQQIRQHVIGNTVTGYDDDDHAFAEFFRPDGTIRGFGNGGRYSGSWSIKWEMLCIDLPDDSGGDTTYYIDDEGSDTYDEVENCWNVMAEGDTVEFMQSIHGGGDSFDGVLFPGNPKGL